MINTQELNYEKVLKVLNEIKEYFDFPQFNSAFGENTSTVKQIVEDTIKAAQQREEPSLIKRSLQLLKELAIGATGSLIASGILALLSTL